MVQNPDWDIDVTLDATCVDIALTGGSCWCPPAERLWLLLDGILQLRATRTRSPGGVAGYVWATQWFDLLRRLQLSVFDAVYDFASGSKAKDWTQQTIPDVVIAELLFDVIL